MVKLRQMQIKKKFNSMKSKKIIQKLSLIKILNKNKILLKKYMKINKVKEKN